MGYTKQGFVNNDETKPLLAEQLIAMEDAIIANETELANRQVGGNYDLNVKAVNHRGYSAIAPENTIPAYILSKQMGFTYVEADVSFTSDGVAVLLHDSTINRTSDGSGNIASMTYDSALSYDFGSWKSSTYAGTKIPTFAEFITACKRIALHPYIELKETGSYTESQIQALVAEVHRCGMAGKATWISFSATFLEYVKNADPKARLGYLKDANASSSLISTVKGLQTGENDVFLDLKYTKLTNEGVQLCVDAGIPLEVWTVNSESDIKNLHPYITGVTSDSLIAGKVLHDAGMIYTAPNAPTLVPTTSITLDRSALEFTVSDTQTLVATVTPSNSTEGISWHSSNESVAVVAGGVVTPVGTGSCTITATSGSCSATCSVTVNIEEIVTYSVTNNLTGVSSDNDSTKVLAGRIYTATLTASTYYQLDTVAVTMGGVDITADVYSNGVITIRGVTGDIIITATANDTRTMIHNWDFTTSMIDSIGGVEAVTTATQGSDGITFGKENVYINLTPDGAKAYRNMTFEIDIPSASLANKQTHMRLFGISNNTTQYPYHDTATDASVLIYRYNNDIGWTWYVTGWGDKKLDASIYPKAFFGGKTVRIEFDENGYMTVSYAPIGSTNFIGVETFNTPCGYDAGWWVIGSSVNNHMHSVTFSAVRVYSAAN